MSDACNTTWTSSMGKDNDERNRRNRKNAKQITQTVTASRLVPISTSAAGVLMETGIWPAKEYLQYSTMILYHSIITTEKERIAKNIVKEQRKYNLQQTFYSRVHSISKETGVDIKAAEKLRKSAWKKLIKQKIKENIQKRLWDEMEQLTRTIKYDKWERKRYIEQCKEIQLRTSSKSSYTCGT